MREVLRRRKAQQAERIEAAEKFAKKLRGNLGSLTAWVFGSVAMGTFKTWSDIDVFIVAENLPNHPMRRLELLYRYATERIKPKGWTLEEFLAHLGKGDKQLLAMLKARVLLIDDLNLEPILRAKIEETGK
ncbi:MAG: nucleotidyltransferase domain-containing protein [Armatimonadota bacterium]|nr:nucleotidyltransferase domain-containing protein [Armatimonadota bacterium]MDW8026586.1 nucleotidyltransferase domain-containing protein [Armatimonadota bacterium]